LKKLPSPLRLPVSRLVAVLVDADTDVRLAWRGAGSADLVSAARRAGLTDALPDGDAPLRHREAARGLDGATMAVAGLKGRRSRWAAKELRRRRRSR
jgi:hypothetical protein